MGFVASEFLADEVGAAFDDFAAGEGGASASDVEAVFDAEDGEGCDVAGHGECDGGVDEDQIGSAGARAEVAESGGADADAGDDVFGFDVFIVAEPGRRAEAEAWRGVVDAGGGGCAVGGGVGVGGDGADDDAAGHTVLTQVHGFVNKPNTLEEGLA